MHFCLERLERVIKDNKTLSCNRIKNDTALEVTDKLFGNKVFIAEYAPPYAIQLAVRITPSLEDTDDPTLVKLYEFLVGLANKHALQFILEPNKKRGGIGTKFPATPDDLTQMSGNLEDALDELRNFLDTNIDRIREFLREHKIFLD